MRELTRVATRETEAEWLAAARGATVRHLERKVARHRPGDTPRAPRTQAHARRRLVFEVLPEDLATVRAALDAVWREVRGGPEAPSPGALLVAMAEVVLGRRDVNVPAYQTTVTICSGCARSWQRSGGELVAVSDAVAGCAACDGEVVGDADIDSTPVGREVGLVARIVSPPESDLGEGSRSDGPLVASEPGNGRAAAHVGRAAGVAEAERVSRSTHVGHEAAAIDHLRHLAAGGGARPILRVMTRALGIPLTL